MSLRSPIWPACPHEADLSAAGTLEQVARLAFIAPVAGGRMDASETERNVIICSMAHPLEIKVAQARRRVRRLFVVYGASRVLAIVVPAFFVLGGIDYLLRFEDRG